MKIKSFYLIVIPCVFIILAVVFAGEKIETNQYNGSDISFDYPQSWQIINGTSTPEIVVFTDPKSGSNLTVNKQAIPAGYTPPENFTLKSSAAEQSGFKFVSHSVVDLNGTEAHENVYQITQNGTSLKRTEIWAEKNGALYSIIFTSPTNSSESSKQLDVVAKSMSIKNSTTENTNIIGTLSLPTLGKTWNIHTETVNAYNDVYHSPSFYPGENGTVGIYGHHTKYSAPFDEIDQLKVGDQVIINDFITQKKYIYQVTSNGDIKWDYETNPVQFLAGNAELTLITCYPKGYSEAAYMTHTQLVGVEPL
ncbi:class E sortase [Methanobacterium paludis]|uniref:Peptidase C60 sortase A and B n=1 Tax=Methanobacterium paludis (strain DSM 25820 / JCM 18151 / SWAN1) TaxID=868131 RepID=F6D642_METPW|nr:class E sortase [Methanobacterium paludis]AEG17690.1 peptidase C60 sortase A and B [Methanobacterium paludis]